MSVFAAALEGLPHEGHLDTDPNTNGDHPSSRRFLSDNRLEIAGVEPSAVGWTNSSCTETPVCPGEAVGLAGFAIEFDQHGW